MNIRKLSLYLEFLTFSFMIFVLGKNQPESELKSIIAFCIFITIDSLLFAREYYTLIKTKKAFMIKTRRTFFSFDTLFSLTLMLLFFAVLIYNHFENRNSGFGELILTTLVSLKGLYFRKQKDSILVANDILFFNRFSEQDILLHEIKNIDIISKKNNIEISTTDLKLVIIRVDKEYFNDNKTKLVRFSKIIKSDRKYQ